MSLFLSSSLTNQTNIESAYYKSINNSKKQKSVFLVRKAVSNKAKNDKPFIDFEDSFSSAIKNVNTNWNAQKWFLNVNFLKSCVISLQFFCVYLHNERSYLFKG